MRALFTILATLAASGSARAESAKSGYALVVTNNRSLDPSRPDLHFADDDGANYASLFAEVEGADRVVLLTQLDAATAALNPAWTSRARPPVRAELFRAVEELAERLQADRAEGKSTHLWLVFAGHGDIDRGVGFIELEDGRLTAPELDALVVSRLPADRIHLLLDSCNSYFMLHPRRPGGRRWEASADPSKGLLERHPHVGAVLSTSAEAITYEWSELQSGIFSYEIRSGLRGGADADGDGRISYAELAAFVSVANRPILNDLYRPKVFARGPDARGEETFLELGRVGGRRLRVQAEGQRRLTLRN
jgi:hypothetical protein